MPHWTMLQLFQLVQAQALIIIIIYEFTCLQACMVSWKKCWIQWKWIIERKYTVSGSLLLDLGQQHSSIIVIFCSIFIAFSFIFPERFKSCGLFCLLLACNCNPDGSRTLQCDPSTGNCQCKHNIEGRVCDQCAENKYNISAGCLGKRLVSLHHLWL